jgi:hypothetical protein
MLQISRKAWGNEQHLLRGNYYTSGIWFFMYWYWEQVLWYLQKLELSSSKWSALELNRQHLPESMPISSPEYNEIHIRISFVLRDPVLYCIWLENGMCSVTYNWSSFQFEPEFILLGCKQNISFCVRALCLRHIMVPI